MRSLASRTPLPSAWAWESNVVHLEARNEVVNAYSSHDKAARVFGDLIRTSRLTTACRACRTGRARLPKLRKTKAFEGMKF